MPGYWDATKADQMDDRIWETLAGAEEFKTGERPLYRDLPWGYAVADANGIEIMHTCETGVRIYKWHQGELSIGKKAPKWTYMMALLIMNALYFGEGTDPADDTVKQWMTAYGFELIGG